MSNDVRKPERICTAPTFHSRAIKKATSHRVKKPNFEQAVNYKNQLLGIERLLGVRLKENEDFYRNSDDRKREILIDALEDIADTNLGFSDQLQQVIATWRKPYNPNMEQELIESEHQRSTAIESLCQLKSEAGSREAENHRLEDEIARCQDEIRALESAIDEYKTHLSMDSDLFSRERGTSDALQRLQADFDQMFEKVHEVDIQDDTDELIQMKKDNAILRKELSRKQYEVEITAQINKRLAILTKHDFE